MEKIICTYQYLNVLYCRIQDGKTIPATYICQDLEANIISWKWSTTAEHLNIYIPDNSNLEKSINYFVKLYSMRTRSDREYWLLDVSSLVIGNPDEDSSLNNAIKNLKDLPLDLDDDLFFYSYDQHHHSNNNNKEDDNLGGGDYISIWEFYEIHPSRPRKLKPYGQWNSNAEKQLSLTKESKWNRRRDLEVCILSDYKIF